MPPFIPHKRRLSTSPPLKSPTPKSGTKHKPSLFDTVDQPGASTTLQDNRIFLDSLNRAESESSLSNLSSDEFEDIIPSSPKRRKISHAEDEEEVDEEDHQIDWEDAFQQGDTPSAISAPEPSGDLELTLKSDSRTDFSNPMGKKKGPSKIERRIRIDTHCMHVQFLLFHNLVRNGWLCDKEIHDTLIRQLPTSVKREVTKWKLASGIGSSLSALPVTLAQKGKGKKAAQNERNQRDWGRPAERSEVGAPNMSRGDPLIRLLKVLAAYWEKRWTVTAPGLRKQGYKPLAILEDEITSFKNSKHSAEEHGEQVRDVLGFRELAKKCEGSRDAGAQLFTALVRGLGIEARLVASLQPIGFGWSKAEEASVKKKNTSRKAEKDDSGTTTSEDESISDVRPVSKKASKPDKQSVGRKAHLKGARDAPVEISEESATENMDNVHSDDDASVIDVTPTTPRKRPNMNYDRDMVYPTYWAESISPITNEVFPVDPFVLKPAVATNSEHLSLFESRGAKADKAKQVFAYVIGFSSDGTAKDVTTRYLKRHMWPGRTKGVRMPVEKVPVFNKKGKIKRYEDYDWFRTVISGYSRPENSRTAVDDLEETKDLKAVKPEKKELSVCEDSLQGYKSSAEFVLERHLRREEAIRPGSKPVKTFVAGKGDKAKEEPVYLRENVEVCRTGESWHKEGRAVKPGETPMKMVPVRAVTLTRKREVEEAERETGEKLKQGLYSWAQTDWIIPPPIEGGVIPKNAFGNMDCYVPTMVPKGAVHIPLRSTVRVCKNLGINYAEAVTGFEFGNKRAVPVITGVVVAEENEKAVIDQWEQDEEERKIKEEGKREKAALATWRKWLMGLRIIQRVHDEYGGEADTHVREGMNPFTNPSKVKKVPVNNPDLQPGKDGGPMKEDDDENFGGGFLVNDEMEGGDFFTEEREEGDDIHGETTLTVEGEVPGSSNTPVLVTLADSSAKMDDDRFRDNMDNEPSDAKAPKSKPLTSGTGSKQSKPPPQADSPERQDLKHNPKPSSKKPSINPTKRKVAMSPDRSDQEMMHGHASPERATRAAPRRKAARKSEMAVKSHFFDDSDQKDDESSDESGERLESGDDATKKPTVRGNKRRAPFRCRPLRARKKA